MINENRLYVYNDNLLDLKFIPNIEEGEYAEVSMKLASEFTDAEIKEHKSRLIGEIRLDNYGEVIE